MALLDEGRRSADVVCDESCTVAVLSLDALNELGEKFPTISQSIQANLARLLFPAATRRECADPSPRALIPTLLKSHRCDLLLMLFVLTYATVVHKTAARAGDLRG